ncbi:MAG: MBL fold metallo-hydrolase [Candidatus Saccharibacteria bacterium]
MFELEYKGANCVIITTKKAKIVVDPKLSIVGMKDISTKDAVELCTEQRFSVDSREANIMIEGPGEYGVAGLDIKGIACQRHLDSEKDSKQSTIYRIEAGDLRVGLIGNIYEKLSDEQLEELGVVDILIIPVGGNGYTLDASGAAGLVKLIDPKIVIPVHYSDSSIKYEVPQSSLDLFVAELSAPVEKVAKYKLKQLPIAQTTLSIVEVTRS